MPRLRYAAALLLLVGCGGHVEVAAPRAPAAATGSAVDESALDRSVDPCDDFYRYACGGWIAHTELPPDEPLWIRSFSEVVRRNQQELRRVLEDAAAGTLADRDARRLGDFWTSCMAENEGDSAPAALAQLMARIDRVDDRPSLAKTVAWLQLGPARPLFELRPQQDARDPQMVIAMLDQSTLGLPSREDYLDQRADAAELRAAYTAHVRSMLALAGEPQPRAAGDAATVLRIETALARASLPRAEHQDPGRVYHRMDRAALAALAPHFAWADYFDELGHPGVTQLNVATPTFFAALDAELVRTSIADWRTYLRWRLVHAAAPTLSRPFVDEDFAFYGQKLSGARAIAPRWKRCVELADAALGDALSRPFVQRTFGAAGKADSQRMLAEIEAAMAASLAGLSWMDAPTRAHALAKLHAVANQIGFPDRWRSYDALVIGKESLLDNVLAATAFARKHELDRIDAPVDRTEWQLTAATVNAYYDPVLNLMVFPAGILQPPFYDARAPRGFNFGAIGMIMGHELTHAFDSEGRRFDLDGALRDWWTPRVDHEFEARARCLVDQYDGYVVADGVHVDGRLTLGENIADLGGLKLALAAAHASHAGSPESDRLLFIGAAQSACVKRTDAFAKLMARVDTHAPAEFRVDGTLANTPAFAAAFGCRAGQKMVRANMCAVW